MNTRFDPKLTIDAKEEIEKIAARIRQEVVNTFRKRGAVVGISGGIDSSVTLALAVKAMGADKVLGIMLPEQDSDSKSKKLAQELADRYSVRTLTEPMSPALEGFGCYTRRDEAIRKVFPEYTSAYRMKITLPQTDYTRDRLNFYQITIIDPEGTASTRRLPLDAYLQIVGASNFKQRSRMAMLYYHAELNNYAVLSTANKDEHDLGFIVKFGDGAGDMFPLRHLFKIQVYQLAEFLDIPPVIRERTPTSDTYSADQTQKEFFFGLEFEKLDPVWYGWDQGIPESAISEATGLSIEQVINIIKDIRRKISATEYLRMPPI